MKRSGWALAALAGVGFLALAADAEAEPAAVPLRPKRRKVAAAQAPDEQAPLEPGGDSTITQDRIIDAMWKTLDEGNSSALDTVQNSLKQMTPELQAYVIAAAKGSRAAYNKFLKWKSDFPHELDDANEKADDINNKLDMGLSAVGIAMAALNQYLAIIAAIGLIIKRAVTQGHVERKVEDNLQLWRDWEGSDCLRGLHLDGVNINDVTPRKLKSRIEADLIASRLPAIPRATQFWFTPSVDEFRQAAKGLGLYSEGYLKRAYGFSSVWNLDGSNDVPTTAYEIQQYVTGFSLSVWPFSDEPRWHVIGREDKNAGRPMRVSNDVQAWANNYLGE